MTGHRNAGFLYYLPSGVVRGVVVKFDEADLKLTKKWLTAQLDVVDSRWLGAKDKAGNYDLSNFALAAPGHPLCCAKWCDYWDRCLGAKDDTEQEM